MNTSANQLQSTLGNIAKNESGTIKACVAQEALDYGCDEYIADFFQDLCHHGCISGMISSLIYYCDTHAFYDKHYYEIEALREDYEDSTGIAISIQGDLKNFWAWYSFEQIAYDLANELGLL